MLSLLTIILIGVVLCLLLLFWIARYLRHIGPITGVDVLNGEEGEVHTALTPKGTVYVGGQLWTAETLQGTIPTGARVRVITRHGLTLEVEPVSPEVPYESAKGP
ncbi:MAG: NfeD family protein [Chloroflexi bacterium]|nr:NfeD family protein [Chloroflexota bacterium]MCL5947272.1 NfeD family protein [Chloroflexota bacterium]